MGHPPSTGNTDENMKYICLGYIEPIKFEGCRSTSGELRLTNALSETIVYGATDILSAKGGYHGRIDCIEGARSGKVPRSAERAPQDDKYWGERIETDRTLPNFFQSKKTTILGESPGLLVSLFKSDH